MNNKRLLAARIIFTVLSIAAVGFIFGNSLLSAEDSAEESSTVLELINRLLRAISSDWSAGEFAVRKLAHFTEFAVLCALLTVTVYLYIPKRLRSLLIAAPAGALVAVCDELIQTLSEGRSCEVRDMLIDISGVIFAALFVTLIITLIIKRKKTEGVIIE